MIRRVGVLFLLFFVLLLAGCGNKKEEIKEPYVNPAFKENLNEVYQYIIKRYSIDKKELEKKFGFPIGIQIDSVASPLNELVYDSTYVYRFTSAVFHYYRRSSDKRILQTETDIYSDIKAKTFSVPLKSSMQEILDLFGEPVKTELKDENNFIEEWTYSLYKDEEGSTLYDSIIFIFKEEMLIGFKYIPFIEIYPETVQQEDGSNLQL